LVAAASGRANICSVLLEWGADASYVYHPPRRGLWGQSVSAKACIHGTEPCWSSNAELSNILNHHLCRAVSMYSSRHCCEKQQTCYCSSDPILRGSSCAAIAGGGAIQEGARGTQGCQAGVQGSGRGTAPGAAEEAGAWQAGRWHREDINASLCGSAYDCTGGGIDGGACAMCKTVPIK